MCLGCPGPAACGEGGSCSTCAAEVSASSPCAPPPEGWGWGSADVPRSNPPLGGGGGGSMPSPLADDPARAAVSQRELSPKMSANSREGRGRWGRGCTPPTRVYPPRQPAGARDACTLRAPPCPTIPVGGSRESGRGCLSPPRSFNIPEPLKLCAPPPPQGRLGGEGRGPLLASCVLVLCACSSRLARW